MAKFRFSFKYYQYYASVFKNVGEGVALGTLAAYFLPEVFQMKEAISVLRFLTFMLIGILLIVVGGIMSVRGKVQ